MSRAGRLGCSGGAGNRTVRESSEELALPETRGAKSGALADDPDLNHIFDAWPGLPEPIKAAILALIRTVQSRVARFLRAMLVLCGPREQSQRTVRFVSLSGPVPGLTLAVSRRFARFTLCETEAHDPEVLRVIPAMP